MEIYFMRVLVGSNNLVIDLPYSLYGLILGNPIPRI